MNDYRLNPPRYTVFVYLDDSSMNDTYECMDMEEVESCLYWLGHNPEDSYIMDWETGRRVYTVK